MTRILLALDGTETSVKAAQRALEVFAPAGSDPDALEVVALNVAENPTPWAISGLGYGYVGAWTAQETASQLAGAHERAAEKVAASVEAVGVDATEVVSFGNPADVICRVAAEHHVDVIVVAPHDRGLLDQLFHPSVSKSVIDRAQVPVMVVPDAVKER